MKAQTMNTTDFFHEATLRICGSLEIEAVAKECLEYLKDYIPLDGLMMNYYDEKGRSIVTLTVASKILLNIPKAPIPIPPQGQLSFRTRTETVNIFNNPEENPIPHAIWQSIGLMDKSSLVLSLWFKGKRIGQVDFFVRGRNRYTAEHGQLIEMLRDPFSIAMANSLQYREIINLKDLLADDNRYLREELHRISNVTIMGANGGLRHVMDLVHQVAPLTSHVLLLGETGSGKEVFANAIHYASPRKDGPFIKVNCGAIPENLIDSELFGHEKGAFTGAVTKKLGRFDLANRGTIFLDEIGELPSAAQVRFLRVLQEKKIERVGGTKTEKVDVRIIAATNRNMKEMVASGRFREDLWFRLNVFPIVIPPLRERKSDIPALINHFIILKSKELNLRAIPVLAAGEMERLIAYEWPGNVRELENIVERALIRNCIDTPYRPVSFDIFPGGESIHRRSLPGKNPVGAPLTLDHNTRHHIQMVLDETGGRIQGKGGAAEILGIHPNTLRHRMRKLCIPYGRK